MSSDSSSSLSLLTCCLSKFSKVYVDTNLPRNVKFCLQTLLPKLTPELFSNSVMGMCEISLWISKNNTDTIKVGVDRVFFIIW